MVLPLDIMTIKDEKIGRAYAFFDCDASREQIDNSMPQLRHDAKTPEGLQTLLHEGTSELQLDNILSELIQYPDDYRVMSKERIKKPFEEERRSLASMKYVLVGDYKGACNKEVASELGDIMNLISYGLNTDSDVFRGAVVYEKDGDYFLSE